MIKTIVYVHGSANMYGASRSLLRLVTRIPKPYKPLVVLPEIGPLCDSLEESSIEVVLLPWLQLNVLGRRAFHGLNLVVFIASFLPNVMRFAFFLKQRNASLVHTNNATIIVPACSAALVRVPHIWHIRETLDEYAKLWDRFAETETSLVWRFNSYVALRLWSWYVRFIYAFSVKVICVSRGVCQPFLELGLRKKVDIIYNGLEIPYYTESSIKKMPLDPWVQEDEQYFYVGTVGEIRAGKGQLYLVESFSRFKRRFPEAKVKCLLIGGYTQDNLENFRQIKLAIKESDLENEVIFCGELPDPRPGFARLDLFVLPSIQAEPFGTVVLEAMVSKVPVIATAIGGTLEQIEDGVTGILVPPDDPDWLAAAIATMVYDPQMRKLLMESAFEKANTLFDVEIYVNNVLGVYDVLLIKQS